LANSDGKRDSDGVIDFAAEESHETISTELRAATEEANQHVVESEALSSVALNSSILAFDAICSFEINMAEWHMWGHFNNACLCVY
jgi:hypothetical protein